MMIHQRPMKFRILTEFVLLKKASERVIVELGQQHGFYQEVDRLALVSLELRTVGKTTVCLANGGEAQPVLQDVGRLQLLLNGGPNGLQECLALITAAQEVFEVIKRYRHEVE